MSLIKVQKQGRNENTTRPLSFISLDYFDIIAQAVSFVFVSAMSLILWYWKNSLNIIYQLTNS